MSSIYWKEGFQYVDTNVGPNLSLEDFSIRLIVTFRLYKCLRQLIIIKIFFIQNNVQIVSGS